MEASARQKKLLSSMEVMFHDIRKKRSSPPSSLSRFNFQTTGLKRYFSQPRKGHCYHIRVTVVQTPPLPNLKPNQQAICGVKESARI
jgi:hypothetical protein